MYKAKTKKIATTTNYVFVSWNFVITKILFGLVKKLLDVLLGKG